MGVENSESNVTISEEWNLSVLDNIIQLFPEASFLDIADAHLLKLNDHVFLHLLSPVTSLNPTAVLKLQESYSTHGIGIFNLWKDIWENRREQVIARLKSLCGLNTKYYARQTKPVLINTQIARNFFGQHHLMGFASANTYIGLHQKGELIALAGFSKPILMKTKGPDYYSAELIRFATLSGVTLIGGMSKVIKTFLDVNSISDMMTYADRDWSNGAGYQQLGFELDRVTSSQPIFLEEKSNTRYFEHRLPFKVGDFDTEEEKYNWIANKGFKRIFNTGNLKYYLYT